MYSGCGRGKTSSTNNGFSFLEMTEDYKLTLGCVKTIVVEDISSFYTRFMSGYYKPLEKYVPFHILIYIASMNDDGCSFWEIIEQNTGPDTSMQELAGIDDGYSLFCHDLWDAYLNKYLSEEQKAHKSFMAHAKGHDLWLALK